MAKNDKTNKEWTPLDAIHVISKAIERQINEPNMFGYKPHAKQLAFHTAIETVRLYIGGNRSGKSVGGVIEDLWWVTGRHPYRKIPNKSINGRVIGVDFVNGVQGILLPIFKRWVIPSDLINGSWSDSWSNSERTLTLSNGNTLDFKSTDQDLEKHAGTSKDFIHFDEEPPKKYFEENLLRTIDVGGSVWITMTPVQGMTWTYKTLYQPAMMDPPDPTLSIKVIQVSMSDNPHLSESEKLIALAFLDADTRAIREHGRFVPRGGLVYGDFMQSTHAVLPEEWMPPRDWLVYHSLDHGYNAPTASLHHAVSPDGGSIVTFHEHYEREMTIKEHAQAILEWELTHNIEVYLRTGDPAMKQRQAESGMSVQQLYWDQGIYFALDGVPRNVSPGVDKINTYLKENPHTGMPYWQTTEACENLIREMKALHWDFYTSAKLEDANNVRETIHKKDDHTPDALRYFFTFMPELSAEAMFMTPPKREPLPKSDVGTIWDFIDQQMNEREEGNWNIRVGYDLSEVGYE